MTELDILFYVLAFQTLAFGLGVILSKSPITSALSLVMTMLSVAGLFLTLKATFIAGVQIIVYAGAVLVLFVMVLMLFDIKRETRIFSYGAFGGFMKILFSGIFCGAMLGGLHYALKDVSMMAKYQDNTNSSAIGSDYIIPKHEVLPGQTIAEARVASEISNTKLISKRLFTKYFFPFQVMGLLLLVIPVGVVTLSRVAGGTHARS